MRFAVGLLVGLLIGLPGATASIPSSCLTEAIAISKRPNGTLYMTTRPSQSHIYAVMLDRRCLRNGSPDDYRWPGYKSP